MTIYNFSGDQIYILYGYDVYPVPAEILYIVIKFIWL